MEDQSLQSKSRKGGGRWRHRESQFSDYSDSESGSENVLACAIDEVTRAAKMEELKKFQLLDAMKQLKKEKAMKAKHKKKYSN